MTTFSLGDFEELRPGILVAVAEPAGVNLGVIVGETGCLVIDTGSSPAQGTALRAAAEAAAGVPVIGVLVTHWHYDHLFGLAGFVDLPSYAHASVADRLDSPEAADAAAKLGVDVADLVRPRNGFHLAKVIDVGGRRVEAMHFGPGHTDGDLAVFVPDVSVVFAGDLLESSAPPAIGPDSHLKEWPSAIDGILGVIGEESMVIPGHGPAMDRFESFKQRAELSGFYGQVEHVIGRGIAVEAAYEAGEWPYEEQYVREVLPTAYAQFASHGVVPLRQLPLAKPLS
ncbi:glyoxylase-like metal-dependent hydrolase (beta-lactamase superfamily II) [Propionicimonas paludicola]|uniref:Glyoxylase-like metal-dependent hydrolase (Beta-lactamase superfamily II) n=1 Tax=Propionicimonas paludicola TaxID=185243 RepID=A0A2A9CP80_9ACTN|nr:MBL fold metallo-hydrolase [Propionicimonas paludicola]PFG16148.1 glyoxylase-like metal-dependent hydrolase (beta-lactamase superfamily II) [Propionicimonas paludicola]